MKPKVKRGTQAFSLILLFLAVSFAPWSYDLPEIPEVEDDEYRVMTYNLRYAWSDEVTWEQRKVAITDFLLAYQPDSIGFQEGDTPWMDYLPTALGDEYDWVGVGRDDGVDRGEFAPIFFKISRFKLIDSGTFWISETPDEPSIGWDASTYRICTWAHLEDLQTGEVIAHYNTHLDHVGDDARTKGAELLVQELEKDENKVILTGDFNFIKSSRNYDILEGSFLEDSNEVAEDSMTWGTMNYFTNLRMRLFPAIDFIFVEEGAFTVNHYEVVHQYRHDGKPLSDHYPIFVDYHLA